MKTAQRTFSDHLRSERERLKISQEICARVLGVSLSCLCSWERGQEPKELTKAGVSARLTQLNPGDPELLPNRLWDRSRETTVQ